MKDRLNRLLNTYDSPMIDYPPETISKTVDFLIESGLVFKDELTLDKKILNVIKNYSGVNTAEGLALELTSKSSELIVGKGEKWKYMIF